MAVETAQYGPRPKESLTAYIARVAAEQEAKAATPEGRARARTNDAWLARQKEAQDRRERQIQERTNRYFRRINEQSAKEATARLLASGRVRLFIDPGKPWGAAWLSAASFRVPKLTAQSVPANLGVGALDYAMCELITAEQKGKRVQNPAGFVVDLAKRAMRRERWRWGTAEDAEKQPHLVVPLTEDGEPITTPALRAVKTNVAEHRKTRVPRPADWG